MRHTSFIKDSRRLSNKKSVHVIKFKKDHKKNTNRFLKKRKRAKFNFFR